MLQLATATKVPEPAVVLTGPLPPASVFWAVKYVLTAVTPSHPSRRMVGAAAGSPDVRARRPLRTPVETLSLMSRHTIGTSVLSLRSLLPAHEQAQAEAA